MGKMTSWGIFGGQNDVQPALHIPMVYESMPSNPPSWEYRVLSVDTREDALPDEEHLNELGARGWLLTGVLEFHQSAQHLRVFYYFVRQKSEE